MSNTKEDILNVSLHLFASDGYEAVSVSQIANKLGITKGALYRHYQSKRDIFDSILKKMEEGDSEQAEKYDVPGSSIDEAPESYHNTGLDEVIEYSKSMFSYWTEDDFASSFRKMLVLEQFRNDEMQKLYQQYLVLGPVSYLTDLFKSMGIKDYKKHALMLYSNIFLYYSLYDGAYDKDSVKKQFIDMTDDIKNQIKEG